ncbi:MAG TPA: ABC transporter permease subunit [Candidatus Limiplasma sp.]|jgi:putative aldouronate transport system permease protein|nr:ABC transporter permease subunit [Candidatus Limiplasma sp.]
MTGQGRTLRRGGFLQDLRSNRVYLLLLLPAVLYVLIFCYIPMGGVVIAFKNYNYSSGILGSAWVGMKNFRFLAISNKLWTLTRNTLAYNFVFITVGMFMEVSFAIIINEMRCKWFKKTFQSFMFLPFFISWVVATAVIQTLLDYDSGLITRMVESMGGNMVNIYTTASPWPYLLVFFRMWKGVGYGSIIYLSAISGIDQEMYEAAEIDGANSWQKVFRITVPNLVPTMVIMFLLAVGQIFRGDFGMFYQMVGNNGVLLETADILDLYVYRAMSSGTNLGMSAAAGLYQSVLCFATIMLVNFIVKKIQPDYTLF